MFPVRLLYWNFIPNGTFKYVHVSKAFRKVNAPVTLDNIPSPYSSQQKSSTEIYFNVFNRFGDTYASNVGI